MRILEIDEDVAEVILQMGSECFSEGLLTNESVELLLDIKAEFGELAEEYSWMFHRMEK